MEKPASILLEEAAARLEPFREGGEFADLFREAAPRTSSHDTPENQAIKLVRMAGMYHVLLATLRRFDRFDVAECGCYHGQSSLVIAEVLRRRGFRGRFHVFDSFDGLSPLEPLDQPRARPRTPRQVEALRAHFAAPEEKVRALLVPFGFARVYKGWIPTRFDEVADRRFQFVHVDVDLHRPTRDALEFFFPRLVEGGAMVVDDYNWKGFPGATKAVDDFVEHHPMTLFLPFQMGGCLLLK